MRANQIALAAAALALRAAQGHAEPTPEPALQAGVELALAFPSGDLAIYGFKTSFSPTATGEYGAALGPIRLSGGLLARWTSWRSDPSTTTGAIWTLETHGYARASLRVSRLEFDARLTLGLDTNQASIDSNHIAAIVPSTTHFGFGMNVGIGVGFRATEAVCVRLGFDDHPGTDNYSFSGSVSFEAGDVGRRSAPLTG